jgi:LPXTG-motif cell wall-anchored protein
VGVVSRGRVRRGAVLVGVLTAAMLGLAGPALADGDDGDPPAPPESGRVVAADDEVTITLRDASERFDVLANDTDAEGEPAGVGGETTAELLDEVPPDSGGIVHLDDGELTYFPGGCFTGTFDLRYRITDAADPGNTAGATITVHVADSASPPGAAEDHLSTDTHGFVRADLYANDCVNTRARPTPATATAALLPQFPPSKGKAAFDATTGILTYQATPGSTGFDAFAYRLTSHFGADNSADGAILIKITPAAPPKARPRPPAAHSGPPPGFFAPDLPPAHPAALPNTGPTAVVPLTATGVGLLLTGSLTTLLARRRRTT